MSETALKVAREGKSTNSTIQNVNRSASRTNYTGIPIQLKERLEQTTGLLLDDVRVHYNSGLPAKLDALAYTRGIRLRSPLVRSIICPMSWAMWYSRSWESSVPMQCIPAVWR